MLVILGYTAVGAVLCGAICGVIGFVLGGALSIMVHGATTDPIGAIWAFVGLCLGGFSGFVGGAIFGFYKVVSS